MEDLLRNSMEPTLYSEVIVEYNQLPTYYQGSISRFCLIVNQMMTNNDEACQHLLRFIETFDLCNYPGENISAACVRIKEICRALTSEHLPLEILC